MSDDSGIKEHRSWISWFCSLEDHYMLCEIDEEYIKDSFNLYGLKPKFAHYDLAMEMILSSASPSEDELENSRFFEIYQEAADLYGLIHARFITTTKGLSIMREKYLTGKFGTCPRLVCERHPVLPIGLSEELRISRVKIFCSRCEDVYIPKKKCKDIDGAYFGCTFPHLLLVTYPDLKSIAPSVTFVPRIFGFKIYKRKGSKYAEDKASSLIGISHYGEEALKKLKTSLNQNFIQGMQGIQMPRNEGNNMIRDTMILEEQGKKI